MKNKIFEKNKKLIDFLLPLFPKNIRTYKELFSHNFSLSMNFNLKQYQLVNDKNIFVYLLYEILKNESMDLIIDKIKSVKINNKEEFNSFKNTFNEQVLNMNDNDFCYPHINKNILIDLILNFYILTTHSHNQEFIVNKDNTYQGNYGNGYFSPKIEKELIKLIYWLKLNKSQAYFINKNFNDYLDLTLSYSKDDFIYIDLVDIINEKDIIDIYSFLCWCIEKNMRFGVRYSSNTTLSSISLLPSIDKYTNKLKIINNQKFCYLTNVL